MKFLAHASVALFTTLRVVTKYELYVHCYHKIAPQDLN